MTLHDGADGNHHQFPPVVLVHGAWLGGWVWKEVTPYLRAAGYPVFTPTLSGLGERAHQASPEIDLNTHIQDIINLLWYEDLHDVQLVGHSYAGMVISGVAEQAAERIGQLIYLDAFVPRDGECMHDLVSAEEVQRNRGLAQSTGNGWLIPPLGSINSCLPTVNHWANQRRQPQSLATYEQPIRLKQPPQLPQTYILLDQKVVEDPFVTYARQAAADPEWQVRSFPGDHLAMLSKPEPLAALLLEVFHV